MYTTRVCEYYYIYFWLQRLYINYTMCCDYSSPGCTGSTSTLSCAVMLIDSLSVGRTGSRLAPGHCISRWDYSLSELHQLYCAYVVHPDGAVSPLDFLSVGRTGSRRASGQCILRRNYSSSGLHQLYCAYVVHPDASSRRSTSRRSVALALVVRPVTASRGATTHRPDCTSSTAPMLCIRTRRLAARLLVGRSHWLLPCVRSLCLVARLFVVRIAPALLRLCCASGRAILPLDFSSVSRTGSHRAPGHYVSRRDYSLSGLHRFYSAYVVHPDASSRRSTSRWSVALALAVRPVTASRGTTTRRSDCTGSTAPMLCIRTRRSTLDFSAVGRTSSHRVPGHSVVRRDYPSRDRNGYTSPTPRVWVPRHVAQLIVDYFASRKLVRRALGCLGTSRGSSSTTLPTLHVQVPRHIARHFAWLVVDYFASCRLVVDYFTDVVRPGASARRAAHLVPRRRLLHLT
jgi:hypothetical protein